MSITGNMEQKQIKGKVSSVVKVDRSLTKDGYAADAKSTGDALAKRAKLVDLESMVASTIAKLFIPMTQSEYDELVRSGAVDISKYYVIVGDEE